jgi:hypothetical protein
VPDLPDQAKDQYQDQTARQTRQAWGNSENYATIHGDRSVLLRMEIEESPL